MNKMEAFLLRDEKRKTLIGRPFDGRQDWPIRDVIVGVHRNVPELCEKMYDDNLSNEDDLLYFKSDDDDINVYVISHQWPWGSGDLLFESIDSYMKRNPS